MGRGPGGALFIGRVTLVFSCLFPALFFRSGVSNRPMLPLLDGVRNGTETVVAFVGTCRAKDKLIGCWVVSLPSPVLECLPEALAGRHAKWLQIRDHCANGESEADWEEKRDVFHRHHVTIGCERALGCPISHRELDRGPGSIGGDRCKGNCLQSIDYGNDGPTACGDEVDRNDF
ncbi:twitching motility protein PilT [Anopheles sinensis]|uniref:Twitching motility protein PilT n=1 Tax=Anopheles sinensis TaxID=74873 RepID=A0A084VDK7_ANOSI|nr:twitching motility protein PilT [Anopheles sinensis]